MGVGTEVQSCPKCLDPEQVSTFAFAAMAKWSVPSRGRGLIDTKAERVLRCALEVRRRTHGIARHSKRNR